LGVTVRCLAHASFQIKTETQNIYIDPSTKDTGVRMDDLKPADLILITHGHYDHFEKDVVKKIRGPGSQIIAPEKVRKEIGGGLALSLKPGEHMMTTGGIDVLATEAYNVKRFRPNGQPFHPKGFGVGYLLTVEGKRIYHAGDTDLIPEMEKLSGVGVDVAILPAGDTYTMDIKEAAEAALIIRPKVAIPMHLWDTDPEIFKREVGSKTSTKVVLLREREEYRLE